MLNSRYLHQAELLLRCLPIVMECEEFALKGGTAINFFIRNLPRLSVDIDLCFTPLLDGSGTIIRINTAFTIIQNKIKRMLPGSIIDRTMSSKSRDNVKLIVRWRGSTIKIEPNIILRGMVYPVEIKELSNRAQEMFEISMECRLLNVSDLYGSKICAALDRQHPRDLFDIKILLENEGITKKIKNTFIVYLISHPRPISELLSPNFKDISDVFRAEFTGMCETSVLVEELESTRNTLLKNMLKNLTDNDKHFLLSIKQNKPNWALFEIDHIHELPAVKWKLMNISRMGKKKHTMAIENLEKALEI